MNNENNPPAFPRPWGSFHDAQAGMTLRDYFAGQALIALPNIGCGADLDTEDIARAAYQIADAMLEARKDK